MFILTSRSGAMKKNDLLTVFIGKRLFILGATILFLFGCAELIGVGKITEEKSTFDNATIVRMSPAFLYAEGKWLGVPVKLGARWTDKAKDLVALVMLYSSDTRGAGSNMYMNFLGLDINIDGKILNYKTSTQTMHSDSGYNKVSKTIYTESINHVVVPLDILKAMLDAKDSRLRFHTSDGYIDAQFSVEKIPGGQVTSIVQMRKFIEQVQSHL